MLKACSPLPQGGGHARVTEDGISKCTLGGVPLHCVRQVNCNQLDTDCAPRRWCGIIPVIVIHRQEVRPMNAVSAMGAPPQSAISRLK
jgi:hypothetical protein